LLLAANTFAAVPNAAKIPKFYSAKTAISANNTTLTPVAGDAPLYLVHSDANMDGNYLRS